MIRLSPLKLAAWTLSAALASTVMAGAPLLCHPFPCDASQTISDSVCKSAKSSPAAMRALVQSTLERLNKDAPVLARMETIRRAALAIEPNNQAGEELLARLMARALDAEAAGSPDALAWFDAGYLAATYSQSGLETSFGPAVTKGTGASAVPGYAWIDRAITLAGDSPARVYMDLAALLVTSDRRGPEHHLHLKRILASDVQKDPAAQDVLQWIAQINGTTIEAIRAKHAAGHDGR